MKLTSFLIYCALAIPMDGLSYTLQAPSDSGKTKKPDQELVEERLNRDESRLGQLEKFTFHHNSSTETPPKVMGRESGSADVVVQVQDLDNLYREMNGKLESILHRLGTLEKQLETLSSDVDTRMKFLESPKGHGVTDRPQSSLPPTEPCPTDKPHTLHHNPKVHDAPAEPIPADKEAAAKISYDKAYAFLTKGDYHQAMEAFAVFLQQYPASKLAPNAYYWMGESHFAQKDFKKAAVIFGEGYKKYPNSSKAPDFLLKLAKALSTLGSNGDACKTLKKLKKDHSKAPANVTAAADKEFSRLQCQ